MFVHARAFADRDQVERGEVVRFEMHVLPDPRAEQAVNETHQRRPIEVVNVQRADQVLHEPPTQMVVAPKRIPARPNMPEHEPLGCDREEEQDREHHHRNPRRPRDGFERRVPLRLHKEKDKVRRNPTQRAEAEHKVEADGLQNTREEMTRSVSLSGRFPAR